MNMMERALDMLRKVGGLDVPNFDEFQEVGTLVALLHDVGHGPLSHVSEKFLGFQHEDISAQIIKQSNISDILKAKGVQPQRIINIIQHTAPDEDKLLSQLVSSQLDVDRLDYMARDSYFTGVGFGNVDLERIINMLRIFNGAGDLNKHALTMFKGRHSIESYLLGRHLMYQAVYFHKASRGAEKLLANAFRRATEAKELPEEYAFLYKKLPPTAEELLNLDDHSVATALKHWCMSKDKILAELCDRFSNRKLLKAIELSPKKLNEHLESVVKFQELARRNGIDPDFLCPIDGPSDTPYTPYTIKSPDDKTTVTRNIFVYDEDEKAKEISQISEVVRALAKTDYLNRLYVPEGFRSEAEAHLFKK
jgi:HD superfamily phosphohydrolase